MSLYRWLLTFLGFPLGGWLAAVLVGPVHDPAAAAAAGAIAGAVIGLTQWWALRSRVGWRWPVATAFGMASGSALAVVATGAATTPGALALGGLVSGFVVGAGQGLTLRGGPRTAAVWTLAVGLAWAAGWFVTANVIVDAERGYAVFGASGAVVATMLTGLVLRRILGPDGRGAVPPASAADPGFAR
ncbi:hypothetical protein [Arthrobacter sp. AL12]|uniref:hypothetical protein n=1 Tax=Arthrobacter sp. AL12 TaxID=3042241 RepID=UPI00249CC52A|nr:hypothetical protein [Arthrobacter sp. AL12]MDI3212184.1 hypothetical protein [Arthrobacter sp. AL12]